MADSTVTNVLLFAAFLALLVLLVILYKKLNRETDGKYALRRVVYEEGGLRERARRAAAALGTRLGVRPGPRPKRDGVEMRDFGEEPAQEEERSGSPCSDLPSDEPVQARSDAKEESGGPDVFVVLNHFSGSVVWSEREAA
ncbi:uncharacterized protein si:ch211-119e14.1 [Corythoichthys intestinalis]|uniref:uncharacterized protein si:ch211-119e14.1 n=1 Tax=Corythoichthys intestinalis TaxID=161448 RepID=UPI0025A68D2F|nr:uncharacterized protein si:ch211-119e14.1 [Corythoichthys intestinalis]